MTSKHVNRESESPRPVASSILISRMTRSSVIIPYVITLFKLHNNQLPIFPSKCWMEIGISKFFNMPNHIAWVKVYEIAKTEKLSSKKLVIFYM